MALNVKEKDGFRYVDEGRGEVLMLLHGLFGALSNWEGVVARFSKNFRVVIPMLPIYEMPIKDAGLEGLRMFVEEFVKTMRIEKSHYYGQFSWRTRRPALYTEQSREGIKTCIDRKFRPFRERYGRFVSATWQLRLRQRTRRIHLYDPKVASKELVDEVFETTKSIRSGMRIVLHHKSTSGNNLSNDLPNIKQPTLLVWGLNDTITPTMVAHEFNRLIPNSQLKFIDLCCHAPMMEHPDRFNDLVEEFLAPAQ